VNKTFELLLYQTPAKSVNIEVIYQDEMIWMSQKKMATLFDVSVPTINEHLKKIFDSEELPLNSVIRNFRITAADGKVYDTQCYKLDAIIAVGYRVNSTQATDFRKWATNILQEFVTKGFVLDTDRLKNGSLIGKDYFTELLEKVREVRASERRFYQKITDIYAQCSIDYDPKSEITKEFYAKVQNKLHWAIHGRTAAELIVERADHKKDHMGLTTWKNAPDGKILKTDVSVAKNYLIEDELKALNHIVTMYLDYAELQANKKNPMTMVDWAKKLDAFLSFNEFSILQDAGRITAELAKVFAETEYEKYRVIQDRVYQSDFDKLVEIGCRKEGPTNS